MAYGQLQLAQVQKQKIFKLLGSAALSLQKGHLEPPHAIVCIKNIDTEAWGLEKPCYCTKIKEISKWISLLFGAANGT